MPRPAVDFPHISKLTDFVHRFVSFSRAPGFLLAIGLVLGLAGSLLATRLIQGLLYDVAPYDPATLTAVVMTMTVVGVVACWIPALRAAGIDPGTAIRRQ